MVDSFGRDKSSRGLARIGPRWILLVAMVAAIALATVVVSMAHLPGWVAFAQAPAVPVTPFEKPEWELTMAYPTGWTATSGGGAETFVLNREVGGRRDVAGFSVRAGPELAGLGLAAAREVSMPAHYGPVSLEGPNIGYFGNVPALGVTAVFTPTQGLPPGEGGAMKADIYTFDQHGIGYIFVAMAPAADWARHQPEFEAIYNSIKFPELVLPTFGSDTAITPGAAVATTAAARPKAAATAAPAAPRSSGACRNNSAYAADVTIPDYTAFSPGAPFDKVWQIENTGACAWGAGQKLVFVSGERMGAPDNCPIGPVAPGATTEIAVAMVAPEANGTYKGIWQMAAADGKPFGERFTVIVNVVAAGTPAATLSPAPAAGICGPASPAP